MIFKNKKGLEKWVIGMIYGFIVLVILFLAVKLLTAVWDSTATEATCETSVLLRNSAILKGGVGGVSPELISLKCATQYKCITMGGKCPSGYEKIPVISDQEIKQKLAEEMYSCWRMLGQGKIDFVDKSKISERVCLPCAIITFDDKLKGKQITGFQSYLNTANTSSGMTYMQYLTNAKEIEVLGNEVLIDTNKDYTVVFSLYSSSSIGQLVGGGVGLIGGGIIGTMIWPGGGTAILGSAGAYGGNKLGDWLASLVGAKKTEIVPSISLNEYTAENLKSCQRFDAI